MANRYIERLEQLNRVMRYVDPASLRMDNWCGCAIGHARGDPYFVKHFNPEFGKALNGSPMAFLIDYFGLDMGQARSLFLSSGYHELDRAPTPSDVVAKLEVILLKKRSEIECDLIEARSLETV